MIDQRFKYSVPKTSKNAIDVGNRSLLIHATAGRSVRFPWSVIPEYRCREPGKPCKKQHGKVVHAAKLADSSKSGHCLGIVSKKKMILNSDCGRLELGVGYVLVELGTQSDGS